MQSRTIEDDMKIIDDQIKKSQDEQFDKEISEVKKSGIAEFKKMADLGFMTKQEFEEILEKKLAEKNAEIASLKEDWGKLRQYAIRKIAQGENPITTATNMQAPEDPRVAERKRLEQVYGTLDDVPGFPKE